MGINATDRDTVIVIVADNTVHFTSGPLQTTVSGAPLMFPIKGRSVFEAIEKIMQINQVAHHCVDLQQIRRCGDGIDYEVTFSPYRLNQTA